jgi:LEA14-like dessication related protein
MRIFVCFLTSVVLLCGCASRSGPSVSLVNVRFANVTALETTAIFTLRLSNEKPEPIQLSGAVHKFYFNGRYVGDGLTGASIEVPCLGTLTNDVTMHLSNLALTTRFKTMIESRSFDYRIQSVFHGGDKSSRMRTKSEGRLDLKDFTPTPTPANVPTHTP